MAKKAQKDAASNTPTGANVPVTGLNWGMPGYTYDTDYGDAFERDTVPSLHLRDEVLGITASSASSPETPDIVLDSRMGDLGDVIGSDVSIVDHSWMTDTFVDPRTVPEYNYDILPDLQEAWGLKTDGQTTWANRVPNKGRVQVKVDNRATTAVAKTKAAKLVRRAHRESASGVPIKRILEAAEAVKMDDSQAFALAYPGLLRMRRDYGLEGNVFVRASAYPGLLSGKWDKELARVKSAKYLLADDPDTHGKLHDLKRYAGLTVVDTVPWKKAYREYQHPLEVSGRRLASLDTLTGNAAKEALRSAFLAQPVKRERVATHFPVHTPPADRITMEEARRVAMEIISRRTDKYVTAAQLRQEQARKKALLDINQMVYAGRIASEDAERLFATKVSPAKMLQAAKILANQTLVVNGHYKGASYRSHETVNTLWERIGKATTDYVARQDAAAKASILRLASAGLIGATAAQKIVDSPIPTEDKLRIAAQAVSDASLRMREALTGNHPLVKTQKYAGPVYRDQPRWMKVATAEEIAEADRMVAASQDDKSKADLFRMASSGLLTVKQAKKILDKYENPLARYRAAMETISLASVSGAKPAAKDLSSRGEFKGRAYTAAPALAPAPAEDPSKHTASVLKAAHLWMNKGHVKGSLDGLLAQKFTQDVLKAASEPLRQLRERHEGLAGHLYVDANPYLKVGCDKGASLHRTASARMVLATPNCGSCVYNNCGSCSMYGRKIANAISPKVAAMTRKASLADFVPSKVNEFRDEFGVMDAPEMVVDLGGPKASMRVVGSLNGNR